MPRGKPGTSRPFKMHGSRNWYIRYTVPGEPERVESTGTSDEKEARRKLNAKRKEIDDREIGPRGITVGNLLDLYLADKRNTKGYRDAETYVRLHLRPAFGKLLADKITSEHIDRFIEQKLNLPRQPASINRWLEALVRAYTIGREERRPPLIRIKPPVVMLDESDNVREGFLTREDYEMLLSELPPHLQTLLVLGYHWGMRHGELVTLRWNQVDCHANSIRLERRQTKGKQARVAPLYGELRAWLEVAYAGRDAGCQTIVAYQGKSVKATKTAWNSARKRAGVPELVIHDLRRTAVRNMVRAGIPEKQAMLISGHKTRSMFDRYDIVDERDIQLAGEKMAAFEAEQIKVRRVEAEKASGWPVENAYKI